MSKRLLSQRTLFGLNLVFLNFSVVAILAMTFYNLYLQELVQPPEATSAAVLQSVSRDVLASQVLSEINYQRLKVGLDALKENDLLSSAAYKKINDVETYEYFSHINPITQKRWSDFIRESGYEYAEIGENLAMGYQTPEEIVRAWLDSPEHKKNLLSNKFTHSGLAHKQMQYDGEETMVLVHFLCG